MDRSKYTVSPFFIAIIAASLILNSLDEKSLRAAAPPAPPTSSFKSEVIPILVKKCSGCHSNMKKKGGYQLGTFAQLFKQGKSGEDPIVPFKPEKSLLLQRIESQDADERMPPGDDPLSPLEIASIKNWIAKGATSDGVDHQTEFSTLLAATSYPPAPQIYPHKIPIFALKIAADGKSVYAGGHHEITQWDIHTGSLLRRYGNLPQKIQVLDWNHQRTHLLIAGGAPGESGAAFILDVSNNNLQKIPISFTDVIFCCDWSASGDRIVLGSADRSIHLYDLNKHQEIWTSKLHSDWVTGVAFSSDQKFIASAGKDKVVKVLDSKTGNLFTTYNGHRRAFAPFAGSFPIYALKAYENELYSAGSGTAIRRWNIAKAKEESGTAIEMESRFAKAGHTHFLEYSPAKKIFQLLISNKHLFASSEDGIVREFDLNNDKFVRNWQTPSTKPDWLYTLDFDPANNRLLAAGFSGEIHVWNTQSGQWLRSWIASPGFKP